MQSHSIACMWSQHALVTLDRRYASALQVTRWCTQFGHELWMHGGMPAVRRHKVSTQTPGNQQKLLRNCMVQSSGSVP